MAEESAELSDEKLLALTLSDEKYFSFIVSRYKEKFFYYLKRFAGFHNDEIEDIIQAAFIKIYYHLNGFDSRLKFSSWAYRIVHNEAIDELRRQKRSHLPLLPEIEIPDDFSLSEEMDKKIEKDKAVAVLRELKDAYREVLVLRFFEHKDYKEISDILEKPLGSVCTLLNRAKKQFKDKYEKYVR